MGVAALKRVTSLRVDGNVQSLGLSGTGTQWLGIASGRFAESASLPPLVQSDGYDGTDVWNRDNSGLVWNDGSEAGRSAEISNAYMSTYGLWKPAANGATVKSLGRRTDKGRAYDVLQVLAPQSKLPMDVWFDRSTHLVVREMQAVGPVVSDTRLSDYRRGAGVMVPYAVHTESRGNATDIKVTAVAINPPDAEGQLARPVSSVHDFSMNGGGAATTVPFQLVENHVYLNVMLNGKGPYRFIFDTGGQNVVDPAVAKEIGALGKGVLQGSGVGSATESFSFATVESLQVGEAVLKNQLFAVAPVRMGFGVSAGQPVDGLIGWEVLARYVTTFNYGSSQVVLTMPGSGKAENGAQTIPFVFYSTQPQIACAINGIPSQCTIDTGARDTLTMYAPYVAEHPQVRPATLTAPGVTGFGVGGPAYGRLGRLHELAIGNTRLTDLVADYSLAKQGAFAAPFLAANLGGNLLRRFNVTFDYVHQTMVLVPNANAGSHDEYERSGLFVVNLGGKIVVADARPGTPSADAGIARGDAIAAIDGTSTAGMSLDTVRAAFTRPAGTVVHLTLTSKTKPKRDVSLTLRDYV